MTRYFFRFFTLMVLLLGTVGILPAQTSGQTIDSLLNEIASAPSDSVLTQRLNRLTNSEEGMIFFQESGMALRLMEVVDGVTEDPILRARARMGATMSYMAKYEHDSAIYYITQMRQVFAECPTPECQRNTWGYADLLSLLRGEQRHEEVIMLADSLLSLDSLDDYTFQQSYLEKITSLTELGDFDGALSTARTHFNSIPTTDMTAYDRIDVMAQILQIHHLNGDFRAGIRWGREGLLLAEELDYDYYAVLFGVGLAEMLIQRGDLDEAGKLLDKFVPLANEIEAEELQENTDPPAYIFMRGYSVPAKVTLMNFLLARKDTTGLQELISTFETAVVTEPNYLTLHPRRLMLTALSDYYRSQEDYPRAIDYAEQLLAFTKRRTKSLSPYTALALQHLETVQAAAGKVDDAYATVTRLNTYQDSLQSRIQNVYLAQAAAGIDLDEHARARLTAERNIVLEREAAALRSRYFWLALLAAGIILAVIIWSYVRTRRDKEVIEQQSAIVSQSLAEKEMLLREVHHRVKNNLQIISAMLQKQARLSGDEGFRSFVRDGQDRIQSMALIHQKLYRSTDLEGIDVRSYLEELSDNIRNSQDEGTDRITLDLNVDDTQLDIDTAIPVGLILNELITNAYKYAFPDGRQGNILIEFAQQEGKHLLKVIDNGIGLPEGWVPRQTETLGINLVTGLVQQLEGTVEWLQESGGTVVAICF